MDWNMAKVVIENERGDRVGTIDLAVDRQLRVSADADVIRAALSSLVSDITSGASRTISGGLRDGKFVTVAKQASAEGVAALEAVADAILRRHLTVGNARLIARLEEDGE
jgi:hypothetical protein